MEFSITPEQKRQTLEGLIVSTEVQLYQLLFSAGYDPSTFDESSYTVPEEAFPMSVFHQIETQLEKLSQIKVALSEI